MKWNKKSATLCCLSLVVCLSIGGGLGWKFISHEKKQSQKISNLSQKQEALTSKINSQNEIIEQLTTELELLKHDEENQGFNGLYRKLRDGEDINLVVIGDSIGAGCGTTDYNKMWATKLVYWIQDTYGIKCEYVNSSLGGNASFAGYVSVQLLDPDKDYDLAVVCYGQNDMEEGFSYNYEAIIRTLYLNNPECTIIPILESSQHTYTQKMVDICNLADYYGLDIADTIASFNQNEAGMDALLADGCHPNDEGHEVYFQTVKNVIEQGVANEKNYVPMKTIPYNGGVDGFDTFRYIAKDEFEVVGENILEIKIDPIWAFVGINRNWLPGINELDIYVDDTFYVSDNSTSYLNYEVQKISKVNAPPTAIYESIRLEFGSEEQLNAFFGLILCQG